MISDSIRAVILGVVEGVTEFLPVSSTGHLLLAERFFDLGEDNFWKSFAVLIQLGAILAIVAIYFGKLLVWDKVLGLGVTDGLGGWADITANLVVTYMFGKSLVRIIKR